MARPKGTSTYNAKVVEEVIPRVANGETLSAIFREKGEAFPPIATFRNWVTEDVNGLAARYARARENQSESWADSILEISDETSRDTIEDDNGYEKCNHEWISRSRLKVDTRKWLMAKLHPRQYGEKVEQTVKGEMLHKVDDSVVKLLEDIRQKRGA